MGYTIDVAAGHVENVTVTGSGDQFTSGDLRVTGAQATVKNFRANAEIVAAGDSGDYEIRPKDNVTSNQLTVSGDNNRLLVHSNAGQIPMTVSGDGNDIQFVKQLAGT